MKPDPINPTAQVSPSANLSKQEQLAKGIYATYCVTERNNLDRAVELGRILNEIKNGCNAGEWYPKLERLGIKHQRASEFIRVFAMPEAIRLECSSTREALEAEKAHRDGLVSPDPPVVPDQSTPYYEEDESEVIGPNEDPPVEPVKPAPVGELRCSDCLRKHVVNPCPECLRLRVEAKAAAKFTSPATPPRSHSAKPKNGQEVYDHKAFMAKFGPSVRAIDELDDAVKLPPVVKAGMIRRLEEIANEAKVALTEAKKE